MRRLMAMALAGALIAWPAAAMARTLALLVGVADYDDASGIHDLWGPRNDVSILWRALKARGAALTDITVLAEGIPPAAEFPAVKGAPSSANILAELDRLKDEAKSGDTVIFYYSGHGTRQPVDPASEQEEPEADGMDQVLLPADAGAYDPIRLTIANAIVDNTLGDRLTAIRARGAFVWAIVDACHSGTVTRGDVTRSVDPARLGVPQSAPRAAARGGAREGTLRAKSLAGEGGLVGFYAVESYDQAIERPFPGYDLPMVGEGNRQRLGVFTYLLHRALTANRAATYRDLAREIVADLTSDRTGGKVPPPVFDGDLDAPLPGAAGMRIPNAVAGTVAGGTITFPVGALHGYDAGARLALYAPGAPDKPIGHAEISEATAVASKVTAIDWVQGADQIASGTVAAVVVEPPISFRFTVSPPPAADHATAAERALVDAALQRALGDGSRQLGIEAAAPGDPDADALLRLRDGRLWVVRPDRPWVTQAGAYGETPSLALADGPLAARLTDALWSLARAARLLRVAAALDTSAGEDDGIAVAATLSRAAGRDERAACKDKPEGGEASPIEPLLPVAAGNCSFVEIAVRNDGDMDYYVAGFYVDALGGVAAIPANVAQRGCARTLPAGSDRALSFRFWIDTWDEAAQKPSTTGAENFVLLAIPKDKAREPPSLCALTQPTLAAMQQTRAVELAGERGGSRKLAQLIGAVAGASTRGISAAPEEGDLRLSGRLFVFDVKP